MELHLFYAAPPLYISYIFCTFYQLSDKCSQLCCLLLCHLQVWSSLRHVIHSYISCLEHIDSSYSGQRWLGCHDVNGKDFCIGHPLWGESTDVQWIDYLHTGTVMFTKMCNSVTYKMSRTHWLILLWAKMAGVSWWHRGMEMISALLALCEGNPLVAGGFPSQRANNAHY